MSDSAIVTDTARRSALDVRGLAVRRGDRAVLERVDLSLPPGTSCAIVGPNGAGKTSLMLAIAGTLPLAAGEARVAGLCTATAARRAIAARVSYMPQHTSFPFGWTALEVALMGAAARRSALGGASADDRHAAHEALELVGIAHLATRTVNHLSGGERQRVVLAMQLVQNADVMLLDEPTSALDFAGVAAVLRVVRERQRSGRTIVAAVHDLNVAAQLDRVAILHEGTIAAFGTPDDVLRSDVLRAAYGAAYELIDTERGPVIVPARVD